MDHSALSLPQCVGYVAFVFGVASFLQKSDKRLKVLNTVQCVVYAAHFFLMGNFPASASNMVGATRNILSLKTNSVYVAFALMVGVVALGWFTVRTPAGLIPISATIISIYGMFWLSGVPFRLCMLVCTCFWLVNNFITKSYGGLMLETTIATANSFTILRLLADAKRKAPSPL